MMTTTMAVLAFASTLGGNAALAAGLALRAVALRRAAARAVTGGGGGRPGGAAPAQGRTMEPERLCRNCWHMIRGGDPPCCCKPTPAEASTENLLALIRDLQRQIDDIREEGA